MYREHQCGVVCLQEVIWGLLLEATITGIAYLTKMEDNIISCPEILLFDEGFYFQHDAPWHLPHRCKELDVLFHGIWIR
jgi:hypothetical protein